MESLVSDKRVSSVLRLVGKYDMEVRIVAKDIGEVKEILKSIDEKDMVIMAAFLPYIYSTRTGDTQTELISQDDSKRKFTLDKLDFEILRILSANARESITEITRLTGRPEDVIRYRIKALLKNKVILGFYARTNRHRMGCLTYILLLNLKGDADRSELIFLKDVANVFQAKKFEGKYSLGINFYAKDNKELVKVINSVTRIFKDKLVNFDLLTTLERHKFTPYP